MKDDKQINLQTPYEIKLPTCIRKTIEYQHYRYRQGQQPALASPRQTARYERIPPDGFDMAALEVTLCGGTPPPASLVPLPFQGRLYYKLANAVKIKLTTCIGKHLNANITDTGKGNNRRWQAPGGQRGQRANSAGRFRHGSTRSCISRRNPSTSFAGPPPFSREAYLYLGFPERGAGKPQA